MASTPPLPEPVPGEPEPPLPPPDPVSAPLERNAWAGMPGGFNAGSGRFPFVHRALAPPIHSG